MSEIQIEFKNKQTLWTTPPLSLSWFAKDITLLLINEGTPGELLQGLAKIGLTQGLGGVAGGTGF